jgi:predicted nucleotidyltransferase
MDSMSRSSVQRFLDEAAQRLADQPDVETVILYGSHAWGSPDEDSDVDLLIVAHTDEEGTERWLRFRNLLAGDRQRVPFDVLVLTPDELDERREIGDPFIEEILDRGRRLSAA